jgi:hypothetical protein
MRPLTFIVGASVGFLLGSRAGRETYDKIAASAQDLWRNPKTQDAVHQMGETVKAKAPGMGQKVADAASAVKGKMQPSHRESASAGQGFGGESGQGFGGDTDQGYGGHTGLDQGVRTETGSTSDSTLADETGQDWTEQGGTTPGGPATGL